MPVVKTAISLQEPLFQRLEKLAAEKNMSRSGLLAIALEAYLEQQENLKLLREINAAYADEQTEELENAHQFTDLMVAQAEDEW